MEVEAAKMVFGRSVAICTLYYQTCLCDGNAKTIMTLNKMHIYPQPVKKEDCINHIAEFPSDTLYHQLYGTSNAAKKSSEFVKKSRKRHTLVKADLTDKRNKTEWLLYKAG